MFKINQNMIQAIESFNKFDVDMANLIQERIFQNPGKSYQDIFAQKEVGKLQQKLEWFTEEILANIVNAFSYILMQAVAERNFSQILEQLMEHQLSEQHAQLLQTNWKKFGNQYSNEVREKPIAMTSYLKDFEWNLQVPIDSSKLPVKNTADVKGNGERIEENAELFGIDARNPNVIFNFNLEQYTQQDDKKPETFSVRITKQQIQNMFETFETLQDQIDKLQK